MSPYCGIWTLSDLETPKVEPLSPEKRQSLQDQLNEVTRRYCASRDLPSIFRADNPWWNFPPATTVTPPVDMRAKLRALMKQIEQEDAAPVAIGPPRPALFENDYQQAKRFFADDCNWKRMGFGHV